MGLAQIGEPQPPVGIEHRHRDVGLGAEVVAHGLRPGKDRLRMTRRVRLAAMAGVLGVGFVSGAGCSGSGEGGAFVGRGVEEASTVGVLTTWVISGVGSITLTLREDSTFKKSNAPAPNVRTRQMQQITNKTKIAMTTVIIQGRFMN